MWCGSCGSVLRDFVLPKLFKSKRYVICPYIDMANHVGVVGEGNVAFEYFANAYSSLVSTNTADGTIPNRQLGFPMEPGRIIPFSKTMDL